jgi:hypothetical protein
MVATANDPGRLTASSLAEAASTDLTIGSAVTSTRFEHRTITAANDRACQPGQLPIAVDYHVKIDSNWRWRGFLKQRDINRVILDKDTPRFALLANIPGNQSQGHVSQHTTVNSIPAAHPPT